MTSGIPKRRSWRLKKQPFYTERLLCAFSKIQMEEIVKKADKEKSSLVEVIRVCVDKVFSLDGEKANGRYNG